MTRHQARRRPAAIPGSRLHREVDEAVRKLQDIGHDDERTLRLVNDSLHGALAYTAALGETCQIASAVAAVRDAESHLDGADPEQARAALLKALQCLTDAAKAATQRRTAPSPRLGPDDHGAAAASTHRRTAATPPG
ncbi:hypothetical protein KIPE111705_01290 [Kibdelosporangium persicum]|uniref:Uncharacterized protein n=1 Tax=Kibdelosporangium persicum TaxID=2698649 RepID=A0ABX2F6H6_9PSEU|nr:hypothetical protein [Kibdelosporangium persicum]NRN66968.1 hypothetical protein [Kibdelosporangium persicum]